MLQIPCRFLGSNWINISSTSTVRHISTAGFPLQINVTPSLLALPPKAKKKIDPAILRAREEKRKKRIEKQIRYLKKFEKHLKPLSEMEVPQSIKEEAERRRRNVVVPEEVAESRILLFKEYTKVRRNEFYKDKIFIRNLLKSQENALTQLRLESEELYQAAVQIDENLIPFKFSGPAETPPEKSYPSPDGDYFDISKKWV